MVPKYFVSASVAAFIIFAVLIFHYLNSINFHQVKSGNSEVSVLKEIKPVQSEKRINSNLNKFLLII